VFIYCLFLEMPLSQTAESRTWKDPD